MWISDTVRNGGEDGIRRSTAAPRGTSDQRPTATMRIAVSESTTCYYSGVSRIRSGQGVLLLLYYVRGVPLTRRDAPADELRGACVTVSGPRSRDCGEDGPPRGRARRMTALAVRVRLDGISDEAVWSSHLG